LKTVVIDAWAVMAWLNNELPAADVVDKLFQDAEAGDLRILLSEVNAGEVFYNLAKDQSRFAAMEFRTKLPGLPVVLLTPASDDVWRAADLKSRYPISYADCFAAALALTHDAELVTGDKDFRKNSIENLRVAWLTRDQR
jgi:predicted nucleic acid-binding protein